MPKAHGVHVLDPASANVLVTEPAGHATHGIVVNALKKPGAHAVQAVAPLLFSVSVTEPGGHVAHIVSFHTASMTVSTTRLLIVPLIKTSAD